MLKPLDFVINAGQKWAINVTRNIYATLGSNVIIQCSFLSAVALNPSNVRVFWKRSVNTYVFHANEKYVLEKYRGKTKLIGKKEEGNCSLMIQDIREEDSHIYLRVNVDGNEYSFANDFVNITLSGEHFHDVPVYIVNILLHNRSQIEVFSPFLSQKYDHYCCFSLTLTQTERQCMINFTHWRTLCTVANQQWTTIIICVSVAAPVALLAAFLAGGIFLRLKRKR